MSQGLIDPIEPEDDGARHADTRPGVGCATLVIGAILAIMALGPMPMRGESNLTALNRAFWPDSLVRAEFVADRLDQAHIGAGLTDDLLRVYPACCSMEPISYNPANWLAWHVMAGFRGAPAWLMELDFYYRRGGAVYHYRTFGRLTRGGGYLTEYSGADRRIAVQDAGDCPVDRLPSGLTVLAARTAEPLPLQSQPQGQPSLPVIAKIASDPCNPDDVPQNGAVSFLTHGERAALDEALSALASECSALHYRKLRNRECHGRPIVIASVSDQTVARSRAAARKLLQGAM